jgi:hypothetical protein
VPAILLALAVIHRRPYPVMMAWTGVILLVCLAPIGIWLFDRARAARTQPGAKLASETRQEIAP